MGEARAAVENRHFAGGAALNGKVLNLNGLRKIGRWKPVIEAVFVPWKNTTAARRRNLPFGNQKVIERLSD